MVSARADLDILSEAFSRDGVVVVRAAAGPATVEALRRVANDVMERPRPLRTTDGEARPDSYLWLTEPACIDAIAASRLPELAARLLRSTRVRLFYDQLFAKPYGRSVPTDWHADMPFWPLEGTQVCSIWLALDPAGPTAGGLRYRAGRPARELAITMDAGDAVVHRGDTVHASFPNTDPTHDRRAYVTRWLGDDVRFRQRPGTGGFPVEVGLVDGDELDHPLFPVLWDTSWT